MSVVVRGWFPGRWLGTLLVGVLLCLAASAVPLSPLLPAAQERTETGERLVLSSPVPIEGGDESCARLLADEIALQGAKADTVAKNKRGILLGLVGQPKMDRELAAAKLTDSVPRQPESYLISITPRGVLAVGRDETGLFYAVQSLRQLLRAEKPGDGVALPCGLIRDWPEMAFRGLSVDLAQGGVPTEEQMRNIIGTCAEYKLNVVSFYVQHLVPFQSTPLMTPKYAELDLDTWRRLAAFATQRHVTLMPQQQTFAHLHHLLKNELYSHLGEVPHGTTLTAKDPEVYEWVKSAVDELCAVFPGNLFHAGGDETWDLGKGANRAEVEADGGQGRLWARHMARVNDILRGHRRRGLFWTDVPLRKPDAIPLLPRDMIAAAWAYNADDKFADYLAPFREAGLDVIVCPSANNWSKPAPDFNVAVTNIGRFVAEGKRQGALGMLNTVWFDDGESLFDTCWYPIVYSASAAWAGTNVDRDCFDADYDWAFHRLEGHEIAGAIRKLGEVHEAARRAGAGDVANKYLWLDPYKGSGKRTYAHLQPEASGMRVLSEEALTAIVRNARHCRLHTNALEALDFAARRLDWFGMKVQFAAEISAMYQDARDHVGDKRRVNYDLLNISDINGRVQDLRDAAGEMKEQYRALWLASNRSYLLNGMLAQFDRELFYWLDKADRFAEARACFRANHTLPEPAALGLAE